MNPNQSKTLRDEAQRLVGAIVIRYVTCESLAGLLVNKLTNSNQGTSIFANKTLGAEKKIKALRNAVKKLKAITKDEEIAKVKFLKWLAKLNICRDKRNDIVHSMWTLVPLVIGGDIKFGKLMMARSSKRKVRAVSITAIEKVSNELDDTFLEGIDYLI